MIREARTAKVLAEREFAGSEPPAECPATLTETKDRAIYDHYLDGNMPAEGPIEAFIRSHVEPTS